MNITDRSDACVTEARTRSAAPALQVHVARNVAEVEAIRDLWSAWNTCRDTDIDYCLEYVWQAEGFIRPHVIAIYRHGQPDAILIGRLDHTELRLGLGYFRFGGVAVSLLTIASGGFLGNTSEQNASEFVRSVIGSLKGGEADAALFHQVDTSSPLFKASVREPGSFSRDWQVKSVPRHVMRINGTVEQVYAGLSSGMRAELRRKRKKMAGDFGETLKIERIREKADLAAVITHAEEVARKTYQRGLGVGFEDTEPMRRWLRVCADHQWLRAYLMSAAGKPAAFWMGTCYAGTFCSDYNSFDPALKAYSPGTVLFGSMLEDFCATGVKEIDFGGGEALYKQRFSNWHGIGASVYVFAPTTRGIFFNALRTIVGLLGTAVKKTLDWIGMSSAVKRLWRGRMASKANNSTE